MSIEKVLDSIDKIVQKIWNNEPLNEKEEQMVKRSYNTEDKEPEQSNFKIPSEKEHLFQVTDLISHTDEIGIKMGLDENTYGVKCEIIGGEEEGLTLLNRVNLDPDWKGFFFTKLFLKAIGEPYKGVFDVETDKWVGRQFYATVKHSPSKDGKKTYANIDQYNFDKPVEQYQPPVGEAKKENIAWDN